MRREPEKQKRSFPLHFFPCESPNCEYIFSSVQELVRISGCGAELQSILMSRLGFKSAVYHGDSCLGELDIIPVKDQKFQFPNNEIRIHHLSPVSERCPPLSILQTISSFSVRCKLESASSVDQPHLIHLHASCFYELKVSDRFSIGKMF